MLESTTRARPTVATCVGVSLIARLLLVGALNRYSLSVAILQFAVDFKFAFGVASFSCPPISRLQLIMNIGAIRIEFCRHFQILNGFLRLPRLEHFFS